MIIAFCVFQFILAPIMGIPVTFEQNTIITVVLTTVSILRGYLWRRLFNYIHYRKWRKKFNGYTPMEVAMYERQRRKQLEEDNG